MQYAGHEHRKAEAEAEDHRGHKPKHTGIEMLDTREPIDVSEWSHEKLEDFLAFLPLSQKPLPPAPKNPQEAITGDPEVNLYRGSWALKQKKADAWLASSFDEKSPERPPVHLLYVVRPKPLWVMRDRVKPAARGKRSSEKDCVWMSFHDMYPAARPWRVDYPDDYPPVATLKMTLDQAACFLKKKEDIKDYPGFLRGKKSTPSIFYGMLKARPMKAAAVGNSRFFYQVLKTSAYQALETSTKPDRSEEDNWWIVEHAPGRTMLLSHKSFLENFMLLLGTWIPDSSMNRHPQQNASPVNGGAVQLDVAEKLGPVVSETGWVGEITPQTTSLSDKYVSLPSLDDETELPVYVCDQIRKYPGVSSLSLIADNDYAEEDEKDVRLLWEFTVGNTLDSLENDFSDAQQWEMDTWLHAACGQRLQAHQATDLLVRLAQKYAKEGRDASWPWNRLKKIGCHPDEPFSLQRFIANSDTKPLRAKMEKVALTEMVGGPEKGGEDIVDKTAEVGNVKKPVSKRML